MQSRFYIIYSIYTRRVKKDVAGAYLTYVTTTNVEHNAVTNLK